MRRLAPCQRLLLYLRTRSPDPEPTSAVPISPPLKLAVEDPRIHPQEAPRRSLPGRAHSRSAIDMIDLKTGAEKEHDR